MPMPRGISRLLASLALPLLLLTACESDELQAPPEPEEENLTIDASTGWAFASLSDGSAVSVTDPAASTSWDVAFNATSVMLNGGAAGPGGVQGYCLCQNEGATDPEIVAFTAESEKADFDGTGAADAPDAGSFQSEVLVPGFSGWYAGTGTGATAVSGTTYLVRLSDGLSYAKVRVASLAGPTAGHAGQVTLDYAVQATAEAALGPTQSITLDAAAPVRLDLNTGSTTPTDEEWDLALEGFVIRLNGGVSGAGAAAAYASADAFDAVTSAATDPRAYRADGFGGVFVAHPWYKYNLTGENIIHPTFNVYLLRRGADLYKVQLINYYSTSGEPRRISIRYARLTS